MSQATTGAPQRLIASIAARRAPAARPRTRCRRSRRRRRRSRPARRRDRPARPRTRDRPPRPRSPVRRSCLAATWPSPPLFPLPQTIRTGPCGESPATASASALPGGLHQLRRGNSLLLDRPAIDRPDALGVVERLEPGIQGAAQPGPRGRWRPRPRCRASESGRSRHPGRPPPRRRAPLRRTVGGSPATTSISRRPKPPLSPSALTTASLAANRAARCRPGRARAAAYSRSAAVKTRSARRGWRSRARSRRSISSRSMPTPGTTRRLLAEAGDQLRRRQLAGGAGADRQVVDLVQVGLGFVEVFLFVRRDQRRGQLQRRRAVDETGDRGAAERADGFLVGGAVGERLAGAGREGPGRRGEAVGDRDPLALGGDRPVAWGRGPRCGSRSRSPCRRSRSRRGCRSRAAAGRCWRRCSSLPRRSWFRARRRRRGCFRCRLRRRRRGRRPRRRSFRRRCRLP